MNEARGDLLQKFVRDWRTRAHGAGVQGNRTTKGNLGKIGKNASEAALSEIPRKQGVFEIRPYSRLIVFANIVFGVISMSLEKCLKNQGI